MGDQKALTLESFEEFRTHPWVQNLVPIYKRDAILAKYAVARLISDLGSISTEYADKNGYAVFISIEGRVKRIYRGIKDLSGVRFSCPYLDEVRTTIEQWVRPGLHRLGYGTSLQAAPLRDKDFLDAGNEHGYRSYHFYLRVPTDVDIYGNSKLCLCEVQARSELQHIWAVKSHDLLYKPGTGWQYSDTHVQEDMRQVSNSLRAADQHLVSIRDRIRRVGDT
ncbi:MAG: hypothetical protein DMF53_01845 [Acidobacteria bacterium]|nr:MAG: hypothetical protein DMF53_01845 [Acidobacteriota bacterium]